MPAPNSRTVRVFLSSTFRDFAGERDLLVRKIFPELRRRCRERQVELVDVDLRWGITEEEAQQGKVLPICLAEIDRSRPYFMGFLGERYGWVPEAGQYDRSLLLEQPRLKKNQHLGNKSVTELEILHGVLDNPAMEKRAFFYFRDPAWSEAQGGDYLCEGPAEQARLAELKERIRQSGFPVVENYASPEELAERVREDLWQLIDEAYPESEVPDALTRERMTHEGYGASRLGLYFGGEPYFAAIDAAVTADPRRPILVTGESGGGKSALLANWASRFARQNPNAILLTHYLAVGADAAQPVTLVIRILREISRFTGEELTLEGDPRKALDLLGPWLAKAGAFALDQGGAFVLVLDGLDKMDAPADLGWWPAELPEGVAMVASCLPGAIRDAVTQRMHWETISVSPLGRAECARFIKEHLEKYRKTLLPVFTERILDHPLSGNPLFLRTLLEELRVFGVHEELGERIDYYLASHTIDDLFERVLERVESDNSAESVRTFLEILWAAKESFAEDELLAVSGLPAAAWAPIHIALDESLIGHGGRVAFSHDYVRKAVQDRYLPTEKTRQRVRERLAAFCAESMREGRKNLSLYVRRHAVAHLLEAGDWDGATAALADLEFIGARAKAQELPAMLLDYARAEGLLPEAREKHAVKEDRRTAGADYGKAMVEYAATWTRIRGGSGESEPDLPKPPPSVRPWTNEQIQRERERITTSPNRAERVDAFRKFVATHLAPLTEHAARNGFVANLARNTAPGGPVHEGGARLLAVGRQVKLIRNFHPDEVYSPMEACIGILEAHTGRVTAVSATADGRTAVSACDDGTLRVWDLERCDCIAALQCDGDVFSVTPDGQTAVSAGYDGALRVWDLTRGSCIRVLECHTDSLSAQFVKAISMTPDGALAVSGSEDGKLRVWDLESGECIRVIEAHSDWVTAVFITPDARLAVSASYDGSVRTWELCSGKCLKVLANNGDRLHALAVTPDGRTVTSGGSANILRVRDLEFGAYHLLNRDSTSAVSVTPDGSIVISGNYENQICMWDLRSGGRLQKVLNGHTSFITTIAVIGDGTMALSGSEDNKLILWALESGECAPSRARHAGAVGTLSHTSDGRFLVSSGIGESTLQVWNAESGEFIRDLQGLSDDIWAVCLAPDGGVAVAGGWGGSFCHWAIESGNWLGLHTERRMGAVTRLCLTLDGSVAVAGCWNGTLWVQNLNSGGSLRNLGGHTERVNALSVGQNGRFAVSASQDGTMHLWNLESSDCLRILDGHSGLVDAVSLVPDGCLAISGSRDNTVCVWDLESGECVKSLKGHTGGIRSLAITPDGRLVATSSDDGTLRVWDIMSGECVMVLAENVWGVNAISLAPDGRIATSAREETDLAGASQTVRFWNLDTGEQVAMFFLRGFTRFTIDWSRRRLVAGFYDGRVEFYQIENLSLGPFITSAQRELVSEDLPVGPVTARPVCCGEVIEIPPVLAERIEHWHLAGHDRGDHAYSDPALLLDCPSCGTPLRMNPFFVDVRPWSVD